MDGVGGGGGGGEGATVDLHVFEQTEIFMYVCESDFTCTASMVYLYARVFLFTCRIMERSCRVCAAPVSGLMCWNFFFFFSFLPGEA